MARRFSSNTAAIAYTTGTLNNTDVTSTIALTLPLAGWPGSTPFLAALDKGNATEEVVLVTAVSGTNVTATRGYDGSPKRAHGIGATLQHVASAIDYDEANAHVNANSGVHGVTGSVVGTTDAQTLTNKTLTVPTIADYTNAQHSHGNAATGGNIPQSSVTGLTAALGTFETSAAHAADAALAVHLAGTETVTGAKTFSGGVTVTSGVTADKLVLAANAANTVPLAANNAGGKMHWGFASVTSDASGFFNVTHGCGFTPSVVLVFLLATGGLGGPLVGVDTIGPTTFRSRISNTTVGTSTNVCYVCLG